MYKLFFYLDKEDDEQAKLVDEILNYNNKFRTEYIRQVMLLAALYYPDISIVDIFKFSDAGHNKHATGEFKNKERYYQACLRWPKNQKAESILDDFCLKAEAVNFSLRPAYLLGMFFLGHRLLLEGGAVIPIATSKHQAIDETQSPVKATQPQTAIVVGNDEVNETSQPAKVESTKVKPTAKAALSGLMKRDS